jgi:C-methyltransferase-like protein/putative zinc binding protein/methyltransferase family protein
VCGPDKVQHLRGGLLAQPRVALGVFGDLLESTGRDALPELRDGPPADMDNGVKDVTPHTTCRVCDGPLTEYLSLGDQPLANAFLKPWERDAPEFTVPLTIALCPTCGLSQLTVVVNPGRLYGHYPFQSGVSEPWRAHCEDLAQSYTHDHHGPGFVLDLGANDGTMLAAFDRYGHRVLGVDPVQHLSSVYGMPIVPVFWSAATSREITQRHGKADLILATNVLGHVDDVRDFLTGIALALDRYGMAIIECPHIMPLLYLNAFDTIYHEHLSYWSLGPLKEACHRTGLAVFDAKPQAIHGGTMRYFLCHERMAHLTTGLVELWKREQESDLRNLSPYREFAARVRHVKPKLQEAFTTAGLYGWGASAKGNVLLNYVETPLPAIFDETPSKQGLLTPGMHIPVQALPDDLAPFAGLVLLSWNWANELKRKAKTRGFTGTFLTPIPLPTWHTA